MSIKLVSQVWELDLPRNEKLIALALADHGDDDGAYIFPSVPRIAWKTGYEERQVQTILRALEARGLIRVVAYPKGGRGKATEYKMDIHKCAKLAPFRPPKDADIAPYIDEKDADIAPYQGEKGAVSSKKGAVSAQKGAPGCTPTVIETLRETSEKNTSPQIKSQKHTPTAENTWDAIKGYLEFSVTQPTFDTWVKPVRAASFDDGILTLIVSSSYARDWLDNRLRTDLERAARRAVKVPVTFKVIIGESNGHRPQPGS